MKKTKLLVRVHFPVLQLSRFYYESYTTFDGIHFTLNPVNECDYLIVVNRPGCDIKVRCPPENVWLLFQEHGHFLMHRWMYGKHEGFERIFTPHPNPLDSRHVRFFTPMAWLHRRTPEYLQAVKAADLAKEPGLVAMWSNQMLLPGHRIRQGFWDMLESSHSNEFPLELYGRGRRPVEDKWDVFKRFAYALAIENAKVTGYWTEKIMDAFLSYTLPFYYGSDDIGSYFPTESFIPIDPLDFLASRETIREAILTEQQKKRTLALEEARHRVINEHSFVPCVSRLVHDHHRPRKRKQVLLRTVPA